MFLYADQIIPGSPKPWDQGKGCVTFVETASCGVNSGEWFNNAKTFTAFSDVAKTKHFNHILMLP